jgi:hypothetical protein
MKIGHEFMPHHGFTGSAKPETDMRPSIPGYDRGGMTEKEPKEHNDHPKHDHMTYDKDGYEKHHKGHGHKAMKKHHGGHKEHHKE